MRTKPRESTRDNKDTGRGREQGKGRGGAMEDTRTQGRKEGKERGQRERVSVST